MTNRSDDYLAQILKNWVDQSEPHAAGKARLLLLASTSASRAIHIPSFPRYQLHGHIRPQYGMTSNLAIEVFHNSWLLRFHLA